MPPRQTTPCDPEVVEQLVADASQGATDGEAEHVTMLEVSPLMCIEDNGLMIVTDAVSVSDANGLQRRQMSSPCAIKTKEDGRELQEGANIRSTKKFNKKMKVRKNIFSFLLLKTSVV